MLAPAVASVSPNRTRPAGISLACFGRYLVAIFLVLLASCSDRPPQAAVLDQSPTPPLASWKPSLHLADTALSGGAPVIALKITDDLLAMNPRNVGALVRRGDALTALNRPGDAAASYTAALEVEPQNSKALVGLGRIRLLDDPAAAEALFARAMVSDRNDATVLNDLGVARDMQGHHAAAQEAYHMALGVTPTSIPVQVNLGLSMAVSGNAAGAVRVLTPLAAASDAAPRVRQNLALALTLNNRKDQASALLQRDLPADQVPLALHGFEAFRQ